MIKVNKQENVNMDNEEEEEDKDEKDVEKTPTIKREVNPQEVVAKEITQDRMSDNLISPKSNAIIVKSMVIMLRSAGVLLAMLKRRQIILKIKKQSLLCY